MHELPEGPAARVSGQNEPKDTRTKIEYDKKLQVFKVDRYLYSPMVYQGNYGFVPPTLEEDGDALDVLVLSIEPVGTGILVEARPHRSPGND